LRVRYSSRPSNGSRCRTVGRRRRGNRAPS
jgi:hypothetical protein